MQRLYSMCLDAAIASVVLVPLFLLLNKYYFCNKIRTCFYILFAVYLSGMFAVVGLPDIRYIRFDPNYNCIPFAYMFSDYVNSILNVILFLPLGVFLPLLWMRYKQGTRTLLFGFCVSLLIEVLQLFTFRATDVNDLITNTLGTLIGWCIARIVLLLVPRIYPGRRTMELYVTCAAAFAVMFFLHPFLSEFLWTVLH